MVHLPDKYRLLLVEVREKIQLPLDIAEWLSIALNLCHEICELPVIVDTVFDEDCFVDVLEILCVVELLEHELAHKLDDARLESWEESHSLCDGILERLSIELVILVEGHDVTAVTLIVQERLQV